MKILPSKNDDFCDRWEDYEVSSSPSMRMVFGNIRMDGAEPLQGHRVDTTDTPPHNAKPEGWSGAPEPEPEPEAWDDEADESTLPPEGVPPMPKLAAGEDEIRRNWKRKRQKATNGNGKAKAKAAPPVRLCSLSTVFYRFSTAVLLKTMNFVFKRWMFSRRVTSLSALQR